MTDPGYHLNQMVAECEAIIEGEYGDETQDHIDAFMDEMSGFRFPLHCTRSSDIPNDRTIRGMRRAKGWLVSNMAGLTSQSGDVTTISATAKADASASAGVTMSGVFERLESCVDDEGELSKLKTAVADLEASRGKDPETVCDKASRLLDLAKKGADVVKAVAPLVATVMNGIG